MTIQIQDAASASDINELARLAGHPELAANLVSRQLSRKGALRELLAARSPQIRTESGSPTLGASRDQEVSTGTASNPLIAAVHRHLASQGIAPAGESSTVVAENVKSTLQPQPINQLESELAARAAKNPLMAAALASLRARGIAPNLAHLGDQR